jgi:hypothetical protein
MERARRALTICLVVALAALLAFAATAHAVGLQMSAARKAARGQALKASEAAVGSLLEEGRGNARIRVRTCTRVTKRKVLCAWSTRGGVEQEDGHVVLYRCTGRARIRLRGTGSRRPEADTTFDCQVRL